MEVPGKLGLEWEKYWSAGENFEVCHFLLYRSGIRGIMFASSALAGNEKKRMEFYQQRRWVDLL